MCDIGAIKLLAKQGRSKAQIAEFLGLTEKDVLYWYDEYFFGGIKGVLKRKQNGK